MKELFQGLVPAEGKAALIYQAVLELLAEGRDITAIKVSDITGRAGIGKGTAYEYFSSREEIIVQAILWHLGKMILEACDAVEKASGFQGKYLVVLDWIEKRLMRWTTFEMFLKIQKKDDTSAFHREFCKHVPDEDVLMESLDILVEAGRQDSSIRPDLSDCAVKYTVLSQLLAFVLFLHRREQETELTAHEMKCFLLEALLKTVGGN